MKIILFFILIIFFNNGYSQLYDKSEILESGFFLGAGKGDIGYALTFGLTEYKYGIKSTRKISGVVDAYKKNKNIADFSILFGKQFEIGCLTNSLSVGISLVMGDRLKQGMFGMKLGLPVEVQLYRTPDFYSRFNFSYGLNFFMNVNKYSSFGGITFMINSLGKHIHKRRNKATSSQFNFMLDEIIN